MSETPLLAALMAVAAMAVSTVATADNPAVQQKTLSNLAQEMPQGFERCYGIAKAAKNDCASGSQACATLAKTDAAKNAWIGVPKGTCSKIVGGSTTSS